METCENMKSDMSIKAIECFSTYQGEGLFSGKRVVLIRFKECNRDCWYCDTKNKMKYYEEGEYKLEDIQKLIDVECANLLITGGEVTFNKNFHQTILLSNKLKYSEMYIETNGYKLEELYQYVKNNKNIYFVYSPKIFNDKDLFSDPTDVFMNLIGRNLIIKVLYDGTNPFVEKYLNKIIKYRDCVYLQPMGSTKEDVLKNMKVVLEAADKYKFNISSRLHLVHDFR